MKPETENPHPGKILKESFLIPMNLSVTDFSNEIKIARTLVNGIFRELMPISDRTACAFAKRLNTTKTFWLDLQKNYDSARKEDANARRG